MTELVLIVAAKLVEVEIEFFHDKAGIVSIFSGHLNVDSLGAILALGYLDFLLLLVQLSSFLDRR